MAQPLDRLLARVPLLVLGVLLLVFGLRDAVVPAVLVGCAITALSVTIIALLLAAVRQEHRRQLETGWLPALPVSYRTDRIGTSVERTHGEHRAVIGHGQESFTRASERVLRWEVKTLAGFRVIRVGPEGAFFSDSPVAEGECAVVRLGPLRETVRVVRVVGKARLRGFAYGTLPEHPLRGEEAFLVEWRDDDRVELIIRAFARPHGFTWTLLWPLLAIARRVFIKRYLRALVD